MNHARTRPSPAIWLPVAVVLIAWALVLGAAIAEIGKPWPGFRVNRVATVWVTNEPHLPGVRAGVRPNDQVLAADGVAIPDGPALKAYVREREAHAPVTYRVLRDGRELVLTVPVQQLGPLDFLGSFAVRFLNALATLAIGASVAFLRPDNRAARASMLFCLGWALYAVLDVDFELTYVVHPLVYFAALMTCAGGALAMALHFPETPPWLEQRRALLTLPFAGSALGFVPIAAAFAAWGPSARAVEVGMTIGTAWPAIVLVAGLAIAVGRLRAADNPRSRAQLQVLLLGLLVAYSPHALLANLPRVLFGAAPPPIVLAVTSALFVVFPLSIAYAIVRHGLFDIAIIVKRTTVYAVLTAFLIGGYFATVGALRWLAGQLGLSHASDWENAFATAVIAVAFLPVRAAITGLVDRLFFRTGYDFRTVVNRVTVKAQNTLDLDEMKSQFMSVIGEALHPRFMYVLTKEQGGGSLRAVGPTAVWGDAPTRDLQVLIDDPLLTRDPSALEVEYVPATGLTGLLSPLAALGTHYRLPLQVGEDVVGLVVLGPKRSDEEYSTEDRELLAATRLPLATAIKTAGLVEDKLFKDRVEQDLRRAREVQEAMLPRSLPQLPGYDFAASSVPCYEASGDYYDWFPLTDGRLGIAIADVAGKGIAAALATAMIKSGLYTQIQNDPEVPTVLPALNRLLHEVSRHAAAKSFTTCAYAVLAPETRTLTYACAGHFPPLHWRAATGKVAEYPVIGGFPLGVRATARYPVQELRLAPGDVVVFYTDGVTEAQAPPRSRYEDGEQFETERLAAVVAAHAGEPAQAIHDAIREAVAAFVDGGAQTDDVTLVVLKVLSEGGAA